MAVPVYFAISGDHTIGEVASLVSADVPAEVAGRRLAALASIEDAGPGDLAYMDHPRYAAALATTRAAACLIAPRFVAGTPSGTVPLVVPDPQRAYAAVLARVYPGALRPASTFGSTGITPGSFVHPTARLESGVTVDPGAVIGPCVEIGRGTVIGSGAVIGPEVRVGRDCAIGAGASVLAALIGNRVILHPGVRVGQDGFGYSMGARHAKVPQIGRVVIQDDVEVGANTTIDRGALRDTIVGEGTKIDNLVQIAHNVVIGRHCIIVAQTGIAGSVTLGDYVLIGGQVGIIGHVTVGAGAQIAATSHVNGDVPAGARWGGTPAKPMKDWFREITAVKTLASRRSVAKQDNERDEG